MFCLKFYIFHFIHFSTADHLHIALYILPHSSDEIKPSMMMASLGFKFSVKSIFVSHQVLILAEGVDGFH